MSLLFLNSGAYFKAPCNEFVCYSCTWLPESLNKTCTVTSVSGPLCQTLAFAELKPTIVKFKPKGHKSGEH